MKSEHAEVTAESPYLLSVVDKHLHNIAMPLKKSSSVKPSQKGFKPAPVKSSVPARSRSTVRNTTAQGLGFWEEHQYFIVMVVAILLAGAVAVGVMAAMGKLGPPPSSVTTSSINNSSPSVVSYASDGVTPYNISPYSNSGLCVTVPANQRMANNGSLQLQSCSGTDPRFTTYEFKQSGAMIQYYYSEIVNLIMNVAGGCAAGNPLVQENEDWEPDPAANEVFAYSTITNQLTTCGGMCVRPAGAISAGSPLQIGVCSGTPSEKWTLNPVTGVTPLNCNGFCPNVLYSFEGPSLRMTTTGFEQNPSGQPSQQDWTFTNNAGVARPSNITATGDTPDGQQYAYLTPGSSFFPAGIFAAFQTFHSCSCLTFAASKL
jgi:hypothetical protein